MVRKTIKIKGAPEWFVRSYGSDTIVLDDVEDDPKVWRPMVQEIKERAKDQYEREKRALQERLDQEIDRSRSIRSTIDVFKGPAFAAKGSPAEEQAERQAVEKDKEESLADVADRMSKAHWMDHSAQDLRILHENPDAFKGKGIKLPKWFTKKVRDSQATKERAARSAARLSADIAKDASPFEQIHDPELIDLAAKGLASRAETKDVQKAAARGIRDARHIRQADARAEAKRVGVDEKSFEKYSQAAAGKRVETVPGGLKQPEPFGLELPSAPGLLAPADQIKAQLDAMTADGLNPLSEDMKNQTLKAWQWYVDNGWADADSGRADPENMFATFLGKLNVKGMPQYTSPFGHLLRGEIKGAPALARQAADDWEETIGKRAKEALEAKYGPEGAARMVLNIGKGLWDNFQGISAILEWDVSDRRDALVQALRNHLVDNKGGRPILGVEEELLQKEADTEFAANIFHGMGEGLKRVFTDTQRSFAGDPVNSLAAMVGLARMVNAGRIHVPGSKGAKMKEASAKFLSDLDAHLTGIPAAVEVVKRVPGVIGTAVSKAAPYVLSEKAIDAGRRAKKATRNLFRGYTRLELGSKRADVVSQKVGDEYAAIHAEIEAKIEGGKTESEATREVLADAPSEAADLYAQVRLENGLMINGADEANAAALASGIRDKRAAVQALIDDDTAALKENIPDEVLESVGIAPTFKPKGVRKTTQEGHTTMELDPTMVAKILDDQLDRMIKEGREAEVSDIRKGAVRIRSRLRGGTLNLEDPLIKPDEAGGPPAAYAPNKGVNNISFLAALADEAEGRPIRVTVGADDVSMFQGPLVGPKDVISKIPIQWRTRLPAYVRHATSKAPQMLEAFQAGEGRDYALYLKRSKNVKPARNPKNQAAFDELEETFLQTVDLTPDQFYGQTQLGGLAANVNDFVQELNVRRTARVPGAPVGVPSLYGVIRPAEPVGMGMRELPSPAPPPGTISLPTGLTARQRGALKVEGSPEFRAAIEAMEAERLAESRRPVAPEAEAEAPPTIIPAGPPTPAPRAPAFVIPKHLSGADPKWSGGRKIDWRGRDLEKAIYIAGSKQKSAQKSAFMNLLKEYGFTEADVKRLRGGILKDIKESSRLSEDGAVPAPQRVELPESVMERVSPEAPPVEPTKTNPSVDQAIARHEKGEPIFDVEEQVNILEDTLGRVSRMDGKDVVKAISNRQEIVDRVRRRILSEQMVRELEMSDDIAAGGLWHKRHTPQVFSGDVDSVKAALIENQGGRGSRFVETMELQKPNENTQKHLGLDPEGEYTVPSYVNDGFDFLEKSTLSGNRKLLQKANSLLKRFYTTRNPMTYANNFNSNMLLRGQVTGRFSSDGLVEAMSDIKDYLEGRRKGLSPEKLEMLDVMDERGIFSSTVMSAEVIDKGLTKVPSEILADMLGEKGVSGVAKRGIDGYNKMLRGIEKGYNLADPMFKVDHVYNSSRKMFDDINEGLLPGEHIDLQVDKGVIRRIYRADDGSLRLGGPDGKALSDADVRRMATEQAVDSANALYFDYMDIPKIIDLMRSSGLDAILLNPFFTWNWKAMYVPLVKRGLAREVISSGNNYWTNSGHFKAKRARGMMGAEFKRQLLLQSMGAAGRDEISRSDRLAKILSRYDYASPYRGIINFGPNESFMLGTSGADWSGAQDGVNALIGGSIPGAGQTVEDLTMPPSKAEDLIWARLSDKKGARGITALAERLKENPEYLKETIAQVRSSSPMFDYDPWKSLAKAVGFGKSFVGQIYGQLSSKREDRTTSDTLGTYLSLLLAGSKGFGRAFERAADVVEGERDLSSLAEAIGLRKVSNSVFEKSLRRMGRIQQERVRDDLDLEEIGRMPVEEQNEKLATKEIVNAIIANDMEAFREKVIEEAERNGLEIEYRPGMFTAKGRFVGTEVK